MSNSRRSRRISSVIELEQLETYAGYRIFTESTMGISWADSSKAVLSTF